MLIPLLYGVGRSRHGKILTQLAQLVDTKQVQPLLDSQVFRFSEVAAAHKRAESGQAMGKVVLQQELAQVIQAEDGVRTACDAIEKQL